MRLEDLQYTFRDPFTGKDRVGFDRWRLVREDAPLENVSRVAVRLAESPSGPVRYGGLPRLRPTSEWPSTCYGALGFMGEVDFAVLASELGTNHPAELPSAGLLSLFYAPVPSHVHYRDVPRGYRCHAFVFEADAEPCVERHPPEGVPTLPERRRAASLVVETPHPADVHRRHDPERKLPGAWERWEAARALPPRARDDKLLGHPTWFQNDGRIDAVLHDSGKWPLPKGENVIGEDVRDVATAGVRLRLLWQIHHGDAWADLPFAYLLIDPEDLTARRFDRCVMIEQTD